MPRSIRRTDVYDVFIAEDHELYGVFVTLDGKCCIGMLSDKNGQMVDGTIPRIMALYQSWRTAIDEGRMGMRASEPLVIEPDSPLDKLRRGLFTISRPAVYAEN